MASRDELARPTKGKYRVVPADRAAQKGWSDLVATQLGNMQTLWDILNSAPFEYHDRSRHHQLKGSLGTVNIGGVSYAQWQHELAGGARVWFAVDEKTKTVYLTVCSARHPNQTK